MEKVKVLVIATHPDDEVLGVGGTILKYVEAGHLVDVCIVTQGNEPKYTKSILVEKRHEVERAAKFLGVNELHFLGFPTDHLESIPLTELIDGLQKCINQVQPAIVFTHHRGDVNNDHRMVFDATMVAIRPLANSPIRFVLAYEVLSSTEWGSPFSSTNFIPTLYNDISKQLERKIDALAIYRSELRNYPHPRSLESLRFHAVARGTNIEVQAAECFMIIRMVFRNDNMID